MCVRVQLDLTVQVKHLRLKRLSESPQSDTATVTGRQLRPDTHTHTHTHRGNLVISFPVYRIRSGRRSLIGCLIRDQFLPLTSTGYVSAALRLRHARGADRFNVLIPTRSAALCICSVQLRQSGTRMSEHDAAIQLNLAASRQEVKRRNNKQHLVTFQNKTLRVDTSTQISKKRQIQALLLILQSGTLPVVVFINTDL